MLRTSDRVIRYHNEWNDTYSSVPFTDRELREACYKWQKEVACPWWEKLEKELLASLVEPKLKDDVKNEKIPELE